MAGDWIKIEDSTPDKPEIFWMAEWLGIDADAVTGKLIRVWSWADQHTIDGNAASVTLALLDRVAGVTGFAQAMREAGWLEEHQGNYSFPNFDRHNGETAKARALAAKRAAKHRVKSNASSVTSPLQERYPEKRREENIETTNNSGGKKFAKPTVEEVATYCSERGNSVSPEKFVDYYSANGWRVGKNPMKDWKAAVRTWEKNETRPSASARRSGQRSQADEFHDFLED
jgi:hypothetical protein